MTTKRTPASHVPARTPESVSFEFIERRILRIRGVKVMLDSDLAAIYGVTTSQLNQQVGRNANRFPSDFMFRLRKIEYEALMLQNATSKKGRGGRTKLPQVFTEHGAIMAANVLRSPRAIRMSIFVVRAFVRLRESLKTQKALAQKIMEIENINERLLQLRITQRTVASAVSRGISRPRPLPILFPLSSQHRSLQWGAVARSVNTCPASSFP